MDPRSAPPRATGGEGDGPQIEVRVLAVRPLTETGRWEVAWGIRNRTDQPLLLREAWLPHGRFRGARLRYAPPISIAPAEDVRLETPVACQEEPGSVVENAFLILTAEWGDTPWQIFVRLRVRIDSSGAPRPAVEAISAQPIGFAGPSPLQ